MILFEIMIISIVNIALMELFILVLLFLLLIIIIPQSLGIRNYRFSISWSRLFPEGTTHSLNQEGLEFYNNVIDCCKEHSIEPAITLYHWDLPQCLDEKVREKERERERERENGLYLWKSQQNLNLENYLSYINLIYNLYIFRNIQKFNLLFHL